MTDKREQPDREAPAPDPDPGRASGLEPGGGVPPGETPPAEDSMSGALPDEKDHNPTKGWSKGPLVVLALVVLVFIGYFVARIFST
ncbi:DUF6480 family protein [Streptomyces sp. TRM 70351]|uniref:DUF6480 family protein n=1 Tax=Streptomyces sp. TRM 70351 TaxID=3116552 RepID=UPI002E7B4C81|nr:DUF6480 family protein [Streptomyces sp. TRM 70351]MEE1927026.1 DUF6480 family protein [Streptomyces sp. TRM 70351]